MRRVLIKSQTHRDQNILQQSNGEEAKLMTGKSYLVPTMLIEFVLDITRDASKLHGGGVKRSYLFFLLNYELHVYIV